MGVSWASKCVPPGSGPSTPARQLWRDTSPAPLHASRVDPIESGSPSVGRSHSPEYAVGERKTQGTRAFWGSSPARQVARIGALKRAHSDQGAQSSSCRNPGGSGDAWSGREEDGRGSSESARLHAPPSRRSALRLRLAGRRDHNTHPTALALGGAASLSPPAQGLLWGCPARPLRAYACLGAALPTPASSAPIAPLPAPPPPCNLHPKLPSRLACLHSSPPPG